MFAPRAPDPGASPGTDLGLSGNPRTISGELWMGLELGFSKGHMGGARDFVPEAPSALGEVPGQAPPLSLPALDPLWPLFCSIEQLPWAWVMSIVFMCLAFPNRLQSDPGLLKTSGWGRQGED